MVGERILQKILKLVLLSSSLWLGSCKTKEKFPPLGDKIAGATDLVSSPSGRYFYVLNSDYERRYNSGSIIVIDPDAAEGSQKVNVVPSRRMGRTLVAGQGKLLVTYDDQGAKDIGYVEIWSLSDEANPTLEQALTISCSPINTVLAATQPYFAVSCANGDLYVGILGSNGTEASLDRVRGYGYEHRALYFYEGAKTYLLGFPSASRFSERTDLTALDQKHYVPGADKNSEGTMEEGPNEVPDIFEESATRRRRIGDTLPYRMFVYNVTDELAASTGQTSDNSKLRAIELGTYSSPTQANAELLYVNYVVRDANGLPGTGEGTVDLYSRLYRTDFWECKQALEGSGQVFYISQRSYVYGSTSNQILKFYLDETLLDKVGKSEVRFEQIFQVERSYGTSIDRDSTGRYPGDFEVVKLDGEAMLLINHFRNLVDFPTAPFYSLTRKFLQIPLSEERPSSVDSTDFNTSYYQVAVSSKGKLLTSSFYGGSLYLFDARPAQSLGGQTPIRID